MVKGKKIAGFLAFLAMTVGFSATGFAAESQRADGIGEVGSTVYAAGMSGSNDYGRAIIDIIDWDDSYEDGWKTLDTYNEGVLGCNGEEIFCLEPRVHFKGATPKTVYNATDFYSQEEVTQMALLCKYVDDHTEIEIGQDKSKKYFMKQILIWNVLNESRTFYPEYHQITFNSHDLFTGGFMGWYIPDALNYAKENTEKYTGYGKVLSDGETQNTACFWLEENTGAVAIDKGSANQEMTNGNSCYTLEGAKYGVYLPDSREPVAVITTNAQGKGQAQGLPVGDYQIREIEAPRGYALETSVGDLHVTKGETAIYRTYDKPQSNPLEILLGKIDRETNKNRPQGTASLENAEFTVQYYQGFYDANPASQGIHAEKTWVLRTDAQGYCRFSKAFQMSGDDFYYDSNGNAALPLGTITVQETKAPKGYLKNEEIFVRQITAQGNQESVASYQALTVSEQAQKGVVCLEKQDASGTPSAEGTLKGAVYEIRNSENQVADTLTTNEQGKAESRRLSLGTYTMRETVPSLGYTLDETVYTITFEGNTEADTIFRKQVVSKEKQQKGKIRLQKVDTETGKGPAGEGSLKGAVYEVRDSKNQLQDTMITNEEGKAESKELPLGTYTIQEKIASVGYVVDEKTYTAVFKGNTTNEKLLYIDIVSKEKPQKGKIRLKKLDAETEQNQPQGGAELKGAVYTIYHAEQQEVGTLTIDENGNAVSKELPLGTYTVKETKAPTGYNLDQNTYTVHLESKNRKDLVFEKTVTSKEEVIRGDVEIVKYGADKDGEDLDIKKPLQDITFIFTSKTTKEQYKVITNKNGYADTSNPEERGMLPFDTYVVTEENPYPEYGTIKPFEIKITEEKQKLYFIIENTAVEAPVSVQKRDATTGRIIPLEGTAYQILDQEKNPISMTVSRYPKEEQQDIFETDETGSFMLPQKLSAGTYYLREVHAPEGYLRGELLEFQVQAEAETLENLVVENRNVPVMGKIVIQKEHQTTGEKLAGVVFEIRAAEDIATQEGTMRVTKGTVVDTITTNEQGEAVSKDLYLGTYEVEEIQQTPGFARAEQVYQAVLAYENQTTAVVQETLHIKNQPTKVVIQKTLKDFEEPLSDVSFEIWRKQDQQNAEETRNTYATDKKGEICLEGLLPGTYCIQETSAPAGCLLCLDIEEFTVDEKGLIQGKATGFIKIENDYTKVEFVKQDLHTDENLPGVELEVQDEQGNVLAQWVSGKEAHRIERLPVGNYILVEKAAPKGYLIAEPIPFTVKAVGEIQTITMKDDKTKVQISKTDFTTGKELPGAELELRDQEGKTIDTWTSSETPHMLEALPQGMYTLIETMAPEGYVTAEEVQFTVKDTGEIQKTEMKDDVTKVQISKKDITTNEELPGAELEIQDKDGKTIETWISEKEPHYIEKLPVGTYTLIEKTAPDGYEIAEKVSFEIKDSAEIHKVEMLDQPKPKPAVEKPAEPVQGTTTQTKAPKTGDHQNTGLYQALAASALLVVLLTAYRKRRS